MYLWLMATAEYCATVQITHFWSVKMHENRWRTWEVFCLHLVWRSVHQFLASFQLCIIIEKSLLQQKSCKRIFVCWFLRSSSRKYRVRKAQFRFTFFRLPSQDKKAEVSCLNMHSLRHKNLNIVHRWRDLSWQSCSGVLHSAVWMRYRYKLRDISWLATTLKI